MKLRVLATLALVVLLNTTASAEWFGQKAIRYTPGTAPVDPVFNPTGTIFLNNAHASLGKPSAVIPGFPESEFNGQVFPETPAEPLSPFTPHFGFGELTQIGAGGELVIRLERFVEVGAGLELGVFGNVGLTDVGNRTAPADFSLPFTSFGFDAVRIEVSETGLPGSWAAVSTDPVMIDTPTSFFTDAGGLVGPTFDPADLEPLLKLLTESDFGKPFDNPAGLDAFAGLSVAQIETLLAGSAGGDWLDLSGLSANGSPLERVGYVRFFDPSETFELMAVSINSAQAGDFVVPEPGTWTLLITSLGVAMGLRQRRA